MEDPLSRQRTNLSGPSRACEPLVCSVLFYAVSLCRLKHSYSAMTSVVVYTFKVAKVFLGGSDWICMFLGKMFMNIRG